MMGVTESLDARLILTVNTLLISKGLLLLCPVPIDNEAVSKGESSTSICSPIGKVSMRAFAYVVHDPHFFLSLFLSLSNK